MFTTISRHLSLVSLTLLVLTGCSSVQPTSAGSMHRTSSAATEGATLTAVFETVSTANVGETLILTSGARQLEVSLIEHYFSASGKQCSRYLDHHSGQRRAICRADNGSLNEVSTGRSTEHLHAR